MLRGRGRVSAARQFQLEQALCTQRLSPSTAECAGKRVTAFRF